MVLLSVNNLPYGVNNQLNYEWNCYLLHTCKKNKFNQISSVRSFWFNDYDSMACERQRENNEI